MTRIAARIHLASTALVGPSPSGGVDRRDRGDVPGWVLITVMTAGLVSALWLLAGPALSGMFSEALAKVSGP